MTRLNRKAGEPRTYNQSPLTFCDQCESVFISGWISSDFTAKSFVNFVGEPIRPTLPRSA